MFYYPIVCAVLLSIPAERNVFNRIHLEESNFARVGNDVLNQLRFLSFQKSILLNEAAAAEFVKISRAAQDLIDRFDEHIIKLRTVYKEAGRVDAPLFGRNKLYTYIRNYQGNNPSSFYLKMGLLWMSDASIKKVFKIDTEKLSKEWTEMDLVKKMNELHAAAMSLQMSLGGC